MAALERSRERLEADVVRAAVTCEDDHGDLLAGRQRVPAASARCALSTPLATAAAFSKATWSQDVPRGGREARRRHLETAGGVDDDGRLADRAEDGADDHRYAAALAQRMALRAAVARHAGSARWSSDGTSFTSQADVWSSFSGEDRANVGRVQVAAAEAIDVPV